MGIQKVRNSRKETLKMKLSNTILATIALANANTGPDLYGACVTNDPDEPILPTLKENANVDFDVKSCIAACRSSGSDGYPYAGLTKQSGSILCFCGDEPTDGFDDLYALPRQCPVRCHKYDLESCGGRQLTAMSVWSVPPNADKGDLGGICVYGGPDVFPFWIETSLTDMTPDHCKSSCHGKGY